MSIATAKQALQEFDKFSEECEQAEYTDTGDAWLMLEMLASELRTTIEFLEGALR